MKYIIKRVLIGVSIGVLLMIIKGNFLLVTNARSVNNSNNIIYSVPNNDDLKNYKNLMYSNMFDNNGDWFDTENPEYYIPYFYGIFQYKDLSTNEILYSQVFSQSSSGWPNIQNAWFNMNGRQTLTNLNIEYANAYNTLGRFGLSMYPNSFKPFEVFDTNPNNSYEFLIEIEKENELNFYQGDNIYEEILDNWDIIVYSSSNWNNQFSIKQYVDLEELDYITPNDITNGNKNLAYIKLRFSFSPLLNNRNDLNFYNISIDSDTIVGSNRDLDTPFLFNTNQNDKGFTIKSLSLIKNGVIDLRGGNNNDTSNINYTDLDSVSQNDLKLFDLYEDCDKLDIACHTRNILTAIKQFIVRIGNFVKSIIDFFTHLLVPTDSQWETLKTNFNLILSNARSKLGIVMFPFDLLSNLIEIYVDIITDRTDNYILTIPPLKEPFSNTTIYNGGSLDLGYTFHYGTIGQFYSVYYAFISCYIVLLFIDLCYDALASFISGNLNTQSSITQQDLEYFDTNGEYHSISRTIRSRNKNMRS